MHNFLQRIRKNIIKIIRVHLKKIDREFKVASVMQVPQTIGFVPVGS